MNRCSAFVTYSSSGCVHCKSKSFCGICGNYIFNKLVEVMPLPDGSYKIKYICLYCGEQLKIGDNYQLDDDGAMVHSECFESLEKKRHVIRRAHKFPQEETRMIRRAL